MDNRKKELDTLKVALASADFEQLRQLGHRMKGVGNSYGFEHVSTLGKHIEDGARSGDRARHCQQLERRQHDRHADQVASLVDDDRGECRAGGHAMPAPQPPRARGVTAADREDVVEEAAGRIHRKRPHHTYRRQRTQEQEPAPGPDDAGRAGRPPARTATG